NLERQVLDFSGVFIRGKGGWPAGTVVTVTLNSSIRNAANTTLDTTSSFSFTTITADTTAITIDGPYSTLTNGSIDLDRNSLQASFQFLRSGANRAFANQLTLAPRDVSITEATAPFVPLKGWTLRGKHGLEIQMNGGGGNEFTGMKDNTTYKITINSTFQNTHGGIMSTVGNANVITFTTRLNSGAVARPQIYGGGDDTRLTTKPGDVEAELRLDVNSPSGTALAVSAQDSPNVAFIKALSSSGGSNYEYQSSGPEALLTTPGDHVMTYSVADGTHTITLKTKAFMFNTRDFPTLNTPASGDSTPTCSWSVPTAALKAQAPGFALGIIKQGSNNSSRIVLLSNTTSTYTLPNDQALSSGTYSFILHFF